MRATRDSARDRLLVNVDPNRGTGYWTFRLLKRRWDGSWATLSTQYRTEGSGETRSLNLSAGTYRVAVAGKYGYLGATSSSVTLVR